MIVGSVDHPARAPILVLGLGNLLLRDDAVGLRLLELLADDERFESQVEFVDGGTQGLALLGYLSERRAVLILDAMALGAEPGSVHVLRGAEIDRFAARRAGSAHEGNALELLGAFRLLEREAPEFIVLGVEPAGVSTGIGLTPRVEAGARTGAERARRLLESLLQGAAACA